MLLSIYIIGPSISNSPAQSVSYCDNYGVGHDTGWNTSGQEVSDLQITLASLRVFHHDCSCEGESQRVSCRNGYGWDDLLIFGNPLVGRPIAADAIRTETITRRLGAGLSIPAPTSRTRGRTINAATVWLMKVATTPIIAAHAQAIPYRDRWETWAVIDMAIVLSRPELLTALPRARPPAARMIIVHRKLLKSSFVKIPVPKKSTIGIMAMTPMSPKICSS